MWFIKNKSANLILGLIALVLSFTAQYLLISSYLIPAGILFSFSVVFIVFALRDQIGPQVVLSELHESMQKKSQLGYVLGGIALVFAFLAFSLFDTTVQKILPWLLHLFSIILLVVSVYLLDGMKIDQLSEQLNELAVKKSSKKQIKPSSAKSSKKNKVSVTSRELKAAKKSTKTLTATPSKAKKITKRTKASKELILSEKPLDVSGPPVQNKGFRYAWLTWDVVILLFILVIAAFMRLYKFDQIPFGTWFDEADEGLNALKIMNEPGFFPVFADSTLLPAHYIYLIVLSFKIFGVSTLSIRAINVLIGLGTVAASYMVGKELFNNKMALVLAFFLAVSRWDVIWSRIGMHGITVPFFELLVVGFVLRALKRQQLFDYTMAGISMGLGLCFYPPLRFFPFVVGLFFIVLWINRHDFLKSSWRGMIALFLGTVLAAIPVLYLMTFQSEVFWSRMQYISIFAGKTTQEAWQAVARTTREHLLMFNYLGDRNGRHNLPGTPMLDSISGALMVLGAGLCIWRVRQPGSFLMIFWLLLMLIPGIFSLDFESPQSLRAIGSMPAAYLLAAVPIHGLWQEWDRQKINRQYVFVIPLVVVLTIAGTFNFNIYFNRQANSNDSWSAFSTPETIIAKKMAGLGNDVEYYVSTFYYNTPTINFIAPNVTNYNRLETYDTFPFALKGDKPVLFFIDPERSQIYLQAKKYYPSAAFEEIKSPDGTLVLYQVSLTSADIKAVQGLTLKYYHNEQWNGPPTKEVQVKNLDFNWQDMPIMTDSAPFFAEFEGVLYANEYGKYQFLIKSPSLVEISIDEVPFNVNANEESGFDVLLAKGSHKLRIRTEAVPGKFQLNWQPPSQNLSPIPSSALLLPPFTNNGLLGRYYSDPDWKGSPALEKIDPWVNFYFHQIILPQPYTVEWLGNIKIPASGQYVFGLEAIDESSLWIDGEEILDAQILNQYQEAGIDLTSGLHKIKVRYGNRTGYTHINLFWTPPGMSRELVPQSVLFPPQGDRSLLLP